MSDRSASAIRFIVCVLGLAGACGGLAAEEGEMVYKSPLYPALSPDGRTLYCTCSEAGTLCVVDVDAARVVEEIPVGRSPFGIVCSADGSRAYVSLRDDRTVCEVDLRNRKILRRLEVGFDPCGLCFGPGEESLFVANAAGRNVSVTHLPDGKEFKRLRAGHRPRWAVSSPDGTMVFVTSFIASVVPFRTPPINEFSWLDARTEVVVHRSMLADAIDIERAAFSPDGRRLAVGISRPKNLLPLVQLDQGWAMLNALVLFDVDRLDEPVVAPLDNMGRYYSEPADVVFSPDGQWVYVVCAGADRVLAVSIERLLSAYAKVRPEDRERWADDLAVSPDYVLGEIKVGRAPRGATLSPDGGRLYVANMLDDSVSVIDTQLLRVIGTIGLGGPQVITVRRRGQQVFSDASVSFQGQLSCHSCHPDGHIDGLTWDIESDGLGLDVVDNRSLRDIGPTAPFKWNGKNPDLMHQCGPRAALFFFRSEGYTPEDLHALHVYIESIPLPPNPYRAQGTEPTGGQQRGKTIFFRDLRNDGSLIPPLQRCYTCHSGEYTTDRRMHNVGTFVDTDLTSDFDSAHLTALYDSPPYLHDGSALTIEEVWTVTGPNHGATGDLTKQQLNDLVEYIKSL